MLRKKISVVCFSLFLFAGITYAEEENELGRNESDLDFSQIIVGNDPIEPVNRFLSGAESIFMRWVFRPVGYVYGSIVPRPVIKSFNNFTSNVAFPAPMLSSFLQAKFADGGIVFSRFMINTIMTAGFFDPADYWFNMKPVREDFGQAFASWGIGRGFYVGVPSMYGNNVRDTVGMIFDTALDPKTYIYGGQYFSFVNRVMSDYHAYDQASLENWDAYYLFRDFGSMARDIKVRDWDKPQTIIRDEIKLKGASVSPAVLPVRQCSNELKPRYEPMPRYESQGAPTDTLRILLFQVQAHNSDLWPRLSLWNTTDLVHQFDNRSVAVIAERPQLKYRYLQQKNEKNAPLVILVPGFGSSYIGTTSSALAEMLWENGYSVVIMSSPFSWEFVQSAGTTLAPGFPPDDAADLRHAIQKIIEDLENNYEIRPAAKVLAGYSMGGIYSLFVAAQEERNNSLGIDKYLAINPPVNLVSGICQLDEYYDTWKKWGRELAYERVLMSVAKHYGLWNDSFQWHGYSPLAGDHKQYLMHIENDEAKLLIGYSFKRSLVEVMAALLSRNDALPEAVNYGWVNRQELYNMLAGMNFKNYAEQIMLKQFNRNNQSDYSLKQFSALADLHAIETSLAANNKIRIIHSADDFLVKDSERKWLAKTFGERIVFLQYGAHLGNLYCKTMHDYILQAIAHGNSMPYIDSPEEIFSK